MLLHDSGLFTLECIQHIQMVTHIWPPLIINVHLMVPWSGSTISLGWEGCGMIEIIGFEVRVGGCEWGLGFVAVSHP